MSIGVLSALADTAPVNSAAGNNLSLNWAGYTASAGQYTSISGSWIVPAVATSTLSSGDATWVGIGGISGKDLIQSGTQAIVDSFGNITYNSWYEMLPSASVDLPVAVKPGDFVSVSISEISTNLWQISFIDNTTGQRYVNNFNYTSSMSSAEWIEEMPMINSNFLPLDNFGITNFTNASAIRNGIQYTPFGLGATMVTMVNSNNQITASPSALGSSGNDFSVVRTDNPATISSQISPPKAFRGRGGIRTGTGISTFNPHRFVTVRKRPTYQKVVQYSLGRQFR